MRYVPDIVQRLYDVLPVWVRSVASTGYGVLKNGREVTPEFHRIYRSLEDSQWWALARLREYQADRLLGLLRHAFARVPYYVRLAGDHGLVPSQIQTPDDLKALPILRKETIRQNGRDLLADDAGRRSIRSEVTSGTTGAPLTVSMDHAAYLEAKAAQWLHHAWAGYTHKEWIGILAGYRVLSANRNAPPYWTTNLAGKQVHFSTLHLRPATFRHYLAKLRAARIEFLLGYPSAIGLLAKYMGDAGEEYPLRAVFVSSEPTYPWQREAILKAFGCPLFDYFGQSEKVVTAGSCTEGTGLHLHMELGIAELIPIPDGQGRATIVATSLTNYAMPLIRYELGDVTASYAGECGCGRKHERIHPVVTTRNDFLILPDGTPVSALLLHAPFECADGIGAAQIVQERPEGIMVSIVPTARYSQETGMQIRRALATIVGPGLSVQVQTVPDIPRTRNGKVRFFISHVPQTGVGTSEL